MDKNYHFLSEREEKISNLETIFENCQFKSLNNNSEKLLGMAIDYDAYTITADNLCVIYKHATGIMDVKPEEITYGRLISIEHDGLKDYLRKNINDVLKACTNELKDEEEPILLELLNDDRVEDEVLRLYLTGQANMITMLSDVDDSRIEIAIDCDVVKMVWMNVLHYYRKNKLDDRLTKFVVRYAKGLSQNKCKGDGNSNLFTDIIANTAIPLSEFKLLIGSFDYYIGMDNAINWTELDVEKLKALIDIDAIDFEEDSRKVMATTKAYAYYLTHYKDEFLNNLADVEMTAEAARELLVNVQFSSEEKLKIADVLDESLLDSGLTDSICDLLRQERIDIEGSKLKLMVQLATKTSDKLFLAVMYIGKNVGYRDRI